MVKSHDGDVETEVLLNDEEKIIERKLALIFRPEYLVEILAIMIKERKVIIRMVRLLKRKSH